MKIILVAALLLAAFFAPSITTASLPSCSGPNYNPTQGTHVFVLPGTAGVTQDSEVQGGRTHPLVFDTSGCVTGDGDDETGIGGAAFPEVWRGRCDFWSGHHDGDIGATATVTSNTGNLPVDYTFGTDGQTAGVDTGISPCTGNGVISDSYDTDPFDCGRGNTGHFPGPSATLKANLNPHAVTPSDPDPWAALYGSVRQYAPRPGPNSLIFCEPADGTTWVLFVFGPSVSGLITNPPLLDLEGCPVIGDSSSVGGGLLGTGLLTGPLAGNGECGLHSGVGVPTAGVSTPVDGTITSP